MHKFLGGDSEKAVIYRSENLFSKEKHYIHFFADAPHLIKTVLNSLPNSGSGHCTKFKHFPEKIGSSHPRLFVTHNCFKTEIQVQAGRKYHLIAISWLQTTNIT